MSQENVDQLRKALDAFNRRDLDGLLESIDPAVEWSPPVELPGASTVRGHDGVRQSVADMLDAFGDLRADPERFHRPWRPGNCSLLLARPGERQRHLRRSVRGA